MNCRSCRGVKNRRKIIIILKRNKKKKKYIKYECYKLFLRYDVYIYIYVILCKYLHIILFTLRIIPNSLNDIKQTVRT